MPKQKIIKEAKQAAKVSIIGNLLLAIIKGTAGILGNSFALIADAIESATDVFSSTLVLLGINYSTRPADDNHPYGHGNAEVLVTFLIVGFLIVASLFIAYQSIQNIRYGHETPENYTLFILAGVIITKELMFRYSKKKSQKTKSSSLEADAWHHRSDALTSFAAFIGILISITMGEGYESAEDYAALFASGFIFYNSYKIFRPALGEFMDEHLYDDLIEQIRIKSSEVDGVVDTEKCYVRKSGMFHYVDLHVIVNAQITVDEGHLIGHHLKDHLLAQFPEIMDVLIHIEPDERVKS